MYGILVMVFYPRGRTKKLLMSLHSEVESDSDTVSDIERNTLQGPTIDNTNDDSNINVNHKDLGVNVVQAAEASVSHANSEGTKTIEPKSDDKITIRFKPIGSTSLINPTVFKISSNQPVSMIIKFLCKKLKVKFIYIYILNSFQPNPDESLGELFNNFQVNNELIINYCNSIAFG